MQTDFSWNVSALRYLELYSSLCPVYSETRAHTRVSRYTRKDSYPMNQKPNAQEIKKNLEEKLSRYFGCTPTEASREQMYKAAAMTVRDLLTD